MPKQDRLWIRIPSDLKHLAQKEAERRGMKLSAYVRLILIKHLESH